MHFLAILAAFCLALLPLASPWRLSPLRATVGSDFDLSSAVLAFLNRELSADVRCQWVATQSALAEEAKRRNAWTQGSYVMLEASAKAITLDGVEMDVRVQQKNFFGKTSETLEKTLIPWPEDCKEDVATGSPPALRRALMAVAREARDAAVVPDSGPDVSVALLRLPQGTSATEQSGGNPGQSLELPVNFLLNNVPHSTLARQFIYRDITRAVCEAMADPALPKRGQITCLVPETNPSMDTYRIGTMLELLRDVACEIAFGGVDGEPKRVRFLVQPSMGEGAFTALPLALSGVRALLERMDWGELPPEVATKLAEKEGASGGKATPARDQSKAAPVERPSPPPAPQQSGAAPPDPAEPKVVSVNGNTALTAKPDPAEPKVVSVNGNTAPTAKPDPAEPKVVSVNGNTAPTAKPDPAEPKVVNVNGKAPKKVGKIGRAGYAEPAGNPGPEELKGLITFGTLGADAVDDDIFLYICVAPQNIVGGNVLEPLKALTDAAEARGQRVLVVNPRLEDRPSPNDVMQVRGRGERRAFANSFLENEMYNLRLLYTSGVSYFPIKGAMYRKNYKEPYVLSLRRDVDPADPSGRAYGANVKEVYEPFTTFEGRPTDSQISESFAKFRL